jgi:small subunit ribosomal protein S17
MVLGLVKAVVIKKKMDKTAVVLISQRVKHLKYKKFITKKTKLLVHDLDNVCCVRDFIYIKRTKPISKMKHWRFVKKCN